MIAGIGGAVVAVPLVAVTNTVVGYLKAYSRDQHHLGSGMIGPAPHGSTALSVAPEGEGHVTP